MALRKGYGADVVNHLALSSTKWYIWFSPMNKTIYLKDEEAPVWERARELAGDKLSPVIVTALKQFIAAKEAEPRGFERIEVEFEDADDNRVRKRKAFFGKWVFPESKPFDFTHDDGDTDYYAVAITAKGNAVFLTWTYHERFDHQTARKFHVYPSLVQAAANPNLNLAARGAIDAIGVPIEELDI